MNYEQPLPARQRSWVGRMKMPVRREATR